MKIAVSATGNSLNSEIDPRFGRSEYFVIAELETMRSETLRNPNLMASSCAGISAAHGYGAGHGPGYGMRRRKRHGNGCRTDSDC